LPSPTIAADAVRLGIKVLDKPPSEEALIDFIDATEL
jgi:hypothetical protein